MSTDTPVITPHIDKNWHTLYALPDLNDDNQARREKRAYKAFLFSLLFDYVKYEPVSDGRYLYRLNIRGSDPEEFVVSNKTPCDNFYEVFDAFAINAVAVKNVLAMAKRPLQKERFSSDSVKFETSLLYTQLDQMYIKEYEKEIHTLFDIVMFLRVSTPAALFDNKLGKDMFKVFLETYYEYIQSIVAKEEVNGIFGNFILQQFTAFGKNVGWYTSRWSNLEGYISGLINMAIEELDDKEIETAGTIRKMLKEAEKKQSKAKA